MIAEIGYFTKSIVPEVSGKKNMYDEESTEYTDIEHLKVN